MKLLEKDTKRISEKICRDKVARLVRAEREKQIEARCLESQGCASSKASILLDPTCYS